MHLFNRSDESLSVSLKNQTIQLRCPICHDTVSVFDKSAQCANNHQFDRAKQGYFNLLPSHKKRSKHPGDDAQMVASRMRFLSQGYYQPVVDTIIQALHEHGLTKQSSATVVDAGCGEGFYTDAIAQHFASSSVCGFDIARPAVLAATRRNKTIQWLVASVSDIPLQGAQCDVIISIFSRADWAEFARLLKPKGIVIMLTPGHDHLLDLRQAIYDEVRPYPEDKRLQDLPSGLRMTKQHAIQYDMQLQGSETIMDLLAMTPHYWHVKPAQKAQLAQKDSLKCAVDMRLSVIEKVAV